jgi:hypothetical protein
MRTISIRVLSGVIVAALLSATPAFAQTGWQSVIPPGELSNLTNYLGQNPAAGNFLASGPNSSSYQQFLANNPGFGQFLTANPNLRNYIQQNPGWFANQQQQYYTAKGFTPAQVKTLDGFLSKHPQIAKQVDQNPRLASNAAFIKQHPELAQFLRQHPSISRQMGKTPWMWSPRQRLAQKDWWRNYPAHGTPNWMNQGGGGQLRAAYNDGYRDGYQAGLAQAQGGDGYEGHRHGHHHDDDDYGPPGRHRGWEKHDHDRDHDHDHHHHDHDDD